MLSSVFLALGLCAQDAEPSKPKIQPVNVRDELIVLIHNLKRTSEKQVTLSSGSDYGITLYTNQLKERVEAQRLLLDALVFLAKETEKERPSVVWHSSNPKPLEHVNIGEVINLDDEPYDLSRTPSEHKKDGSTK